MTITDNRTGKTHPPTTLGNVESAWACPNYPDGDVVVRDGSAVRVRMTRPGDEEGLLDLSNRYRKNRDGGDSFRGACGAGGMQVELLRDVSVRLTPLSKEDASEMIRGLKTYPLLTDFRGSPMCDVAALEEGLLRVSALVEDIRQIAELDCNPFVVQQRGAVILDARIRVAAVDPRTLLGAPR